MLKFTEGFVEKFFELRFPQKDLEFEKDIGYFYTWIARFESGHPQLYMDCKSMRIFVQMLKDRDIEMV